MSALARFGMNTDVSTPNQSEGARDGRWTIRVDLGSILGIWAHPDDEAWLSAGLMMQAIAAGHRVTCVTATKGEAGFPADDPRSVAERMAIRESELASLPSASSV